MNKETSLLVIKWVLLILTFVIVTTVAFFLGAKVSYSEQAEIYDSLREVATIIFGVMGAWIAIVYPNSLKNILKWDIDEDANRSNLTRLFSPMRYATVIVAISTLFKWLAPAIIKLDWANSHSSELKVISFFVLGIMVFSLLWSLVLSFVPMELADKEVHDGTEVRKGHTRKRGRAQVDKPLD